jgi:hypothetical protein
MKLSSISVSSCILALMAALIVPPPAAHAAPMTFTAILSGANELPTPVPSPGTGVATVVLDPTAQTLQVNATFSGLTSNTVAAHIHCCAPIGTNAGVATTVPAFPGFPLGVTSGNYSSQIFDLTQPLIYNPAFVNLQSGLTPAERLMQAEVMLIAGIIGGQTYLNIHTSNFPGGEIRGQLAPVPLPAALPLFAAGLGIVTFLVRRRKTTA